MSFVKAYLTPHPPIIIRAVGGVRIYQCEETFNAMKSLGEEVGQLKPKNIIVISPHGTVFSDGIGVLYGDKVSGSLASFGHSEVKMTKSINRDFIDKLVYESGKHEIVCAKVDREFASDLAIPYEIDHGALVPLNFIDEHYSDYNLIHITYGTLSYEELYRFGMIIKEVIDTMDDDYVLVASGDLSHKLLDSGPYNFHEDGPTFDKTLVDLLSKGDYKAVFDMDNKIIRNAGECGYRSVCIMLGTFDGLDVKSDLKSYEGPFGVGYAVMSFNVGGKGKSIFDNLLESKLEHYMHIRDSEDSYVRLARETIKHYVEKDEIIEKSGFIIDEMLESTAGVFVSIKKYGALRGCIGTTSPTKSNLAKEIITNAISAATRDPRFPPIEASELDDLTITVDILGEAEKTDDWSVLDPLKYGVIVEKDYRRGLLLPNLEGVDTVKEQINIALSKAGIKQDESYTLYRFKVTRHY